MEVKAVYIIHITHIDNLESIVNDEGLYSDERSLERNSCKQQIGMSKIKLRRLTEITVSCHPDTKVGHYVPFYFWHHSPMLFLIHKGNSDLDYKGGQESIVHLVSKRQAGIEWAEKSKKNWAFTAGNAGAWLCDFYSDIADIGEIKWESVKKQYWSDCKDEKQAEFLVQDTFPFSLFTHIVVQSQFVKTKVNSILQGQACQPRVEIKPKWYY